MGILKFSIITALNVHVSILHSLKFVVLTRKNILLNVYLRNVAVPA